MTQKRSKEINFRIILSALHVAISALIFCLFLVNRQHVSLNCFFCQQEIPLGVFGFLVWAIGTLTAFMVLSSKDRTKENAKMQLDWQNQDAKLVAEMVADKERLLKAKIDTLEAALKTALKKNN